MEGQGALVLSIRNEKDKKLCLLETLPVYIELITRIIARAQDEASKTDALEISRANGFASAQICIYEKNDEDLPKHGQTKVKTSNCNSTKGNTCAYHGTIHSRKWTPASPADTPSRRRYDYIDGMRMQTIQYGKYNYK